MLPKYKFTLYIQFLFCFYPRSFVNAPSSFLYPAIQPDVMCGLKAFITHTKTLITDIVKNRNPRLNMHEASTNTLLFDLRILFCLLASQEHYPKMSPEATVAKRVLA